MDLKIPQVETLRDVQVTVKCADVVAFELSYQCSACGGYGSPCGACSSGRIVEVCTALQLQKRVGGPTWRMLCDKIQTALTGATGTPPEVPVPGPGRRRTGGDLFPTKVKT